MPGYSELGNASYPPAKPRQNCTESHDDAAGGLGRDLRSEMYLTGDLGLEDVVQIAFPTGFSGASCCTVCRNDFHIYPLL